MINKKIAIIIIICAAFIFGYLSGKRQSSVCRVQRINKEDVKNVRQPVFSDSQIGVRQAMFRGAVKEIDENLNGLDDKLVELEKMMNYFNAKTEQGDKASSIEASMVYEGQYRNSVIAVASSQKEAIGLYKKALKAYKEYADFLELAVGGK